MSVFIDQQGKFYQAKIAKDPGDAKVEHPTPMQLKYLTEKAVTEPEFGVGVREGEVKSLQPVVKKVIEKDKNPEKGNGSSSGVTDETLKNL